MLAVMSLMSELQSYNSYNHRVYGKSKSLVSEMDLSRKGKQINMDG